jgi:transposase
MTFNDRKTRRRKIAEMIRDGASVEDAAQKYKVTRSTVRNACREHSVEAQTKADLRRQQIAQRIADGNDPTSVAREFDVCIGTVVGACKSSGVEAPYGVRALASKTYEIIRELIVRQRLPAGQRVSLGTVASQFGISKQRIHQIFEHCKDAGLFDLDGRRSASN